MVLLDDAHNVRAGAPLVAKPASSVGNYHIRHWQLEGHGCYRGQSTPIGFAEQIEGKSGGSVDDGSLVVRSVRVVNVFW